MKKSHTLKKFSSFNENQSVLSSDEKSWLEAMIGYADDRIAFEENDIEMKNSIFSKLGIGTYHNAISLLRSKDTKKRKFLSNDDWEQVPDINFGSLKYFRVTNIKSYEWFYYRCGQYEGLIKLLNDL